MCLITEECGARRDGSNCALFTLCCIKVQTMKWRWNDYDKILNVLSSPVFPFLPTNATYPVEILCAYATAAPRSKIYSRSESSVCKTGICCQILDILCNSFDIDTSKLPAP